jgi:hypothetical protein
MFTLACLANTSKRSSLYGTSLGEPTKLVVFNVRYLQFLFCYDRTRNINIVIHGYAEHLTVNKFTLNPWLSLFTFFNAFEVQNVDLHIQLITHVLKRLSRLNRNKL